MNLSTLENHPHVLLIETDPALAQLMSIDLKESGYQPIMVSDGMTATHRLNDLEPALIVIDRTLGAESGLSLCSHIRKMGNRTPILLLMTRDSVEDRAACLQAGADDYFIKPYRTDQFLKLIHFYLKPENISTEKLRFGELLLDLETRQAFRNNRVIELTMKEFELLKYLMENPREVLTREQILENVWGDDFLGESNVIEVYIRYLRLKIEEEGEKRLIQTVRGVGYVLRES